MTIVGSVTAELILDSEEFQSNLATVKGEIEGLNSVLAESNAMEMAKEIEQLHNQLAECSKVIEDQSKIINELKKGYK